MMTNKVETKTSVWWDIDSCPAPVGYDASRVGPCIRSALEKLGCSGPITISVMGNLKHTPDHVLRGLSSSGMVVKHGLSGVGNITTDLLNWAAVNPPPARIMFISDSLGVHCFYSTLSWLQVRGFNILLAYENVRAPKHSDLVTCAEWPWKTLLKGVTGMDSGETRRRQPLQEKKCSDQTGESTSFFCNVCFDVTSYEYFACQSLEDFTMHLWGKEHELREFKFKARDLTMDKEYFEMMDGVDPSHPKMVLNKRKKKSNMRRKMFNKRLAKSK